MQDTAEEDSCSRTANAGENTGAEETDSVEKEVEGRVRECMGSCERDYESGTW